MDTNYRSRRLLARLETDPEFRHDYERASREIAQVDAVMRQLDARRQEIRCSKAELGRRVGKNPATIRRLFTTEANPELSTVAALAVALGVRIQLIPERDSPPLAAAQ